MSGLCTTGLFGSSRKFSQQLLIPLFLNVTKQDVDAVEEYREEFLKLGVDAEPAGETVLRVSALPADVEG